MTAGRKKLPTQLKIVRGTAQNCRINKKEPKNIDDLGVPPESLSAAAIKHWENIVPQLVGAGIAKTTDAQAMKMLCEYIAQWDDANEKIKRLGTVIKSEKGYPMMNPYFRIANALFLNISKMLSEFGMTPAARASVSADAGLKELDDPWA